MKWTLFKRLNNGLGWLTFLIAATTYLLTIGPSASLWDCAEFIVSANKLEVGHPPGAPFFMLVYNVISHFTSDPMQVAWWCNVASALISAFTILFLFWSITHMVRRLLISNTKEECEDDRAMTFAQGLTILASGLGGALLYTFTDSFWFSAVEAEVYAFSSFFTALVFWLMLKWEDNADQAGSDRWLVLIAYFLGLSVGVHLLNLLCIPAMALIYYYRRWEKTSIKGAITTLAVSFALIAVMMFGIVQGVPKLGAAFDIFFVNTLGLPYNSGFFFYLILLLALIIWSLFELNLEKRPMLARMSVAATVFLMGIPFMGGSWFVWLVLSAFILLVFYSSKKVLSLEKLHTLEVSLLTILIGFSSYGIILLRASAKTPMNQNCPNTALVLKRYLNREQYGSTPLIYGPTFASRGIRNEKTGEVLSPTPKDNPNTPDKYIKLHDEQRVVYNKYMFFPRMYSTQPAHIYGYNNWIGRHEDDTSQPTFGENLRFFFSYQLNYMYWRYFAWNFIGRTNDLQGLGGRVDGGVLTGISFIDSSIIGSSETLPDKIAKNKGHNVYYLLPLLLGLLGIFIQLARGEKGGQSFWVTFFFFFMTGIAIVLYLNQTTGQPRERDYAYVGSFYAFAIWIGFGIMGLFELLRKVKVPETLSSFVALAIAILVPLQMAAENWDDHDRSGRTVASDTGYNMLVGCAPNSVIFCYGDNDTFPLWYAQEVEGVRTDVRTVNRSYLSGEWYIDQMKQQAYSSSPLPFDSFRPSFYYRNLFASLKDGGIIPVSTAMKLMIDKNPSYGKAVLPSNQLSIPLNANNLRKDYPFLKESRASFDIDIRSSRYLMRDGLAFLDLLSSNKFKRAIYFARTTPVHDVFDNFPTYLSKKGIIYQIKPSVVKGTEQELDLDHTYDLVMNKYRWFGASDPNIYFDENIRSTIRTYYRGIIFPELIDGYLAKNDAVKAQKLVHKCLNEISPEAVPYASSDIPFLISCYETGLKEEADKIALELMESSMRTIRWAMELYKGNSAGKDVFFEVYGSQELPRAIATARNVFLIADENQSEIVRSYEKELALYLSIFYPKEAQDGNREGRTGPQE